MRRHEYRVQVLKANPLYAAQVSWTSAKGRERKAFRSLKKAEAWAEAKNVELYNSGINAFSVPEALRVQALEAQMLVAPYGKSVLDAVKAGVEVWEQEAQSLPLGEAVARFLHAKRKKSDAHQYKLCLLLDGLKESFGDGTMVNAITRPQLIEWLGKQSTDSQHDKARALLSSFFGWCVAQCWRETNPCKRILVREDKDKARARAISILTTEQAAALLKATADEFKAQMALSLFTGVRRSELMRVTPGDVENALEERELSVRVIKTRGPANRPVAVRPNLRAWLEAFPLRQWGEAAFVGHYMCAVGDAGLKPWAPNTARHTFCSHALAGGTPLEVLVREMGHTDAATLYDWYFQRVKTREATAFWRIKPDENLDVCHSAKLPPRS